MTDTLFLATLETARTLGITKNWKASAAGSTTTLVDTVGRLENNDHWNQGTIWITYDAGGAGAAPEGEFSIITDYVQSTGTLTFQALTAATTTNDRYEIAIPLFSLQEIISAVNNVLSGVFVPTWDTTSLDTVAAQTEYDLPAACTSGNLRGVYVQTNDDADDNKPERVERWWVKEGATGSVDTLVMPEYTAGYDIWLKYIARHSSVYLPASKISEVIDLQALGVHAAVILAANAASSGIKSMAGLANLLLNRKESMPLLRSVVPKPNKFRIISGPSSSSYTGEVGKVRI